MGQLRNLAGDTVWYGLSSIIGRIISYLLTPLYTTVFFPGEYGIITELYGYVAFLNIIYMYGLETAYFRFSTKHSEKSGQYFNLTVSSIVTTSLVFSLALSFSANWITQILGYEGQEEVIYWLAAILAIDSVAAIPFAKLRLDRKAKRFATIKLTNISVTIFLNIFFLVFCSKVYDQSLFPGLKPVIDHIYFPEFKVKYVFLSNLLANSLYFLFLFDQFRGFRFQFNYQQLKPVLSYSLPLLIMGLAVVTNEMLSRVLLKYILPENFYPNKSSLDALGIFGACFKLSVFMSLGVQAFRYAAEPFFFSNATDKNSPELFSRVMHGFIIFNSVVFLIISVNLEPLGYIFLRMPEYREGLFIVPFLLMGGLFLGIYYNLSLWFKLTDKTIYGAYITCFGAAITIILNIALIPINGYFGSAITTLVTYFSMVVLSFYLGKKYYPIPYNIPSATIYIVLTSSLAYLAYNINIQNTWIDLLINNSIVLTFLVFIYIMERKNIRGKRILGVKFP